MVGGRRGENQSPIHFSWIFKRSPPFLLFTLRFFFPRVVNVFVGVPEDTAFSQNSGSQQ